MVNDESATLHSSIHYLYIGKNDAFVEFEVDFFKIRKRKRFALLLPFIAF